MFTAIISKAWVGWALRRIPDWGGWLLSMLGAFLAFFFQLDPLTQTIVINVLQGNWAEITLGSIIGLVSLIYSQWRSYKATVSPQVVTSDGAKLNIPVYTEEQVRQVTGYQGPITTR